MPLDSYSLCPGGRDKKIHFCCPDLLKELQQIETMTQNGQPSAGLAMIERLEKDHPNCACLTAAKCVMLRQSGRWEEFIDVAQRFAEAEPDNIQAISENVLGQAAAGDPLEALSLLIDGIEKNEPGKIHQSLLLPILMTASRLLEEGKIFPAAALAKLIQGFDPENRDAAQLLNQIYSRKDIPLVLKELTFDPVAPDDFPFQDRYAEAVLLLATGQWKKGKAILEELQSCVDQWPNLARSLGLVRFWLCDDNGGREALKRFAAFDKVDFDDAVDAETLVFFTWEGGRNDDVSAIQSVRTILDQDKAMERLLSSPTVLNVPFDPRQYGDADHPAPNHIFRILDRPFPADDAKPTLETTPVLLATCLFFGKQTDRNARIEAQFFAPNRDKAVAALTEMLGELIGAEESTEVLARFPWVYHHLEREFQFKASAPATIENLVALYRDYFEKDFIPAWFTHPTDDLGGESPEAFARRDDADRTLSALIQVVGLQADPRFADELMTRLREKAGIAEPASILPPSGDEDGTLQFFKGLPIWRWGRVDLSDVSASVAGRLLGVARLFSEEKSMTNLADRILSFPADKENASARLLAFEVQIEKATTDGRAEEALALIRKGSDEAKDFAVSDARFNLREAMIQISLGRPAEFRRIVEHVAREHRNEPEAMQSLQIMLMNLGLLNPDGTPRAMPTGGPDPSTGMAGAGPQGFPQAAEEPKKSSGLWTPDSDENRSGGGSKLWTPD